MMKSIRGPILLLQLLLVVLIWGASATWFFFDVGRELREVLDARLAESAQMVHSLLARSNTDPQSWEGERSPLSASTLLFPQSRYQRNLSCQVWSGQGNLLTRSGNAPQEPLAGLTMGYEDTHVGGVPWRVYALTDADSQVRILVGEPLALREELIHRLARGTTIPFLIILPVMAGALWLGVGWGLRRVHLLGRYIADRDPEDLSPVAKDFPRELSPFIDSLNQLLNQLQQARVRERRFTTDAAHELRTPLAALRIQAEVALASRERGPRERALQSVLAGVERMTHLSNQLLALAKWESKSYTIVNSSADLHTSLGRAWNEVAEAAQCQAIDCNFDLPEEIPRLVIDEAAFELALRNVFDNAVRYGGNGAGITVTVRQHRRWVVICITDSGPGIPEQHIGKVCERFYRGTDSVHTDGTGLGLSIVQAITRRYGGRFRLEPARSDHSGVRAVFELRCEATINSKLA